MKLEQEQIEIQRLLEFKNDLKYLDVTLVELKMTTYNHIPQIPQIPQIAITLVYRLHRYGSNYYYRIQLGYLNPKSVKWIVNFLRMWFINNTGRYIKDYYNDNKHGTFYFQ